MQWLGNEKAEAHYLRCARCDLIAIYMWCALLIRESCECVLGRIYQEQAQAARLPR